MQSRFLLHLSLQYTLGLILSFFSATHAMAKLGHAPKGSAVEQISTSANPINFVSSARKAERLYYAEAQKALDKSQFSRYEQILPKLKNYPLRPYLEYQALGDRLMALPRKEVALFFERYPNSFLSERLRHRWLRTLASQELWVDYRNFYDPNLNDSELACLNIRARLFAGDKSALIDVEPLWNIEKPQSKACDPVFTEWVQAGMLTPTLLWSRYIKAVQANEMILASNLTQQMTPAQQVLALQYQNVAETPSLVLQTELFNTQLREPRTSVALGLERYGQTNAMEADDLWKTYQKKGGFTEDEIIHINYLLALQLLRQDQDARAEHLVTATPNLSHADLLEALIREALRKQDWQKSYRWISRLPAEVQKSERWSYWQARIMDKLNIKELEGKKTLEIYADLANTRSFYGFLSSDKLGFDYSLVDKPLQLTKEFITAVELSPSIQRARELYLMGNLSASHREWAHTMRYLSTEEIVAAGRLADRWGWHQQAIQTMADAQLWDELQVRFPLVYPENIKNAARQTSLSEHFIFAITRQESAFNADAKSPSGALGLMQMLPSTAKSTAKKYGVSFKNQDLLLPEKNITLGSNYLNQLLGSFSGNRILAAAAYNAGPTRVRQWLTKNNDEKLPYDVWIETIPYKETRNYVQNVLFYSVIYGYRSGDKQSFVTSQEAAQGL
jgi:soluble lytic murein transglycosylase